MVFTSIQV